MFRIGQGIDIHAFTSERNNIVLGGVEIEHDMGLAGHSDADALIHAICDAMLGALAMGDIGQYFSDTDPAYKNANSEMFLQKIYAMVLDKGWHMANIDSTIMTEQPKIAPYVPSMQQNLAKILDLNTNQVSIKATRAEKLGSLGRQEGLMAMANVLLYKK
ncbi:MAG TPA: 2-C-methyl-D-erythritol 2,4-cyclodiphosphate synthase [Oligoflexia bacterium]|nr:2-C-methyl-D-erythritol 2,4-cyclodiphosphate synthase [Oligoflexia bacterium]HMR25212.1 2-C-methyl-D-erythritol 2,4-cyclodiphosphate synthase [Oligoflexia bacterium]